MNKKIVKPLILSRETLRALGEANLRLAAGGLPTGVGCTEGCTYTCRPCTRYC